MKRLDPSSPIPLYAQIAEAIRYQIATGAIAAGEMLPPLRTAAGQWGVNLHTVRRAYTELADRGVVRTDPQVGTVVLGRPAAGPTVDPIDWFVSRMVTEAHERHGLSVEELRLRLDQWGSRSSGGSGGRAVHVIERGEGEAATLATHLRARWVIDAEGWSLERPGGLPNGTLIAPLQYYNEIRSRSAERAGEVHFVRTHPEPEIATRVLTSARPVIRAVLCEKDLPSAAAVVADLRRVLPAGRVEVMPHVVSRPGELLSFVPESLDAVLFPPRMWAALTPAERANPKAHEVRYVVANRDAERLAEELGWSARVAGRS